MTKKRADNVKERIDAAIRDSYRTPNVHRPDSAGQPDWPKATDDTRNHPPQEKSPIRRER